MTTTRSAANGRRRPAKPAIPTPDELEAAWTRDKRPSETWTPRPWVSVADRTAFGRAARQAAPRSGQGAVEFAADRDPVAIILAQEADRLKDLLPLRHGRMAASAFAFYRGAPAVMALDLSTTPRSNITVQASGDAHISNFGLFASPERTLVFDSNDFDETLPGPWEWDVKRLAASVVIAARSNGFTAAEGRTAVLASVRAYREQMAAYSGMRLLDIWYDRTTADDIEASLAQLAKATRAKGAAAKAGAGSSRGPLREGSRQGPDEGEWPAHRRRRRPVADRRRPARRHPRRDPGRGSRRSTRRSATTGRPWPRTGASSSSAIDSSTSRSRSSGSAASAPGASSSCSRDATRAIRCSSRRRRRPRPCLTPYLTSSSHANHGERVVVGQRLMQATPDIFLGWTRGPGGRDFYFRQLWDMKGSVDITTLRPMGLGFYGGLCARSLARAHARSGDSIAIAAYLGTSDTFDGAIADFSEAYADQNELDYAAFTKAIADGKVESAPG